MQKMTIIACPDCDDISLLESCCIDKGATFRGETRVFYFTDEGKHYVRLDEGFYTIDFLTGSRFFAEVSDLEKGYLLTLEDKGYKQFMIGNIDRSYTVIEITSLMGGDDILGFNYCSRYCDYDEMNPSASFFDFCNQAEMNYSVGEVMIDLVKIVYNDDERYHPKLWICYYLGSDGKYYKAYRENRYGDISSYWEVVSEIPGFVAGETSYPWAEYELLSTSDFPYYSRNFLSSCR